MSTFGERFKELRINKKMSQEELITDFNKKFNYNFTKSAVSQYENNKRIPEIQALNDFVSYFNVSIDYILGRTDERNSKIININEKSNETNKLVNNLASELAKEGYTMGEDDYDTMLMALKIALANNKEVLNE